MTGNAALEYSYASKAYRLFFDEFLSDMEIYSVAKAIIASRVFSADNASRVIGKLERFLASEDRENTDRILLKELNDYSESKAGSDNISDNLWQLVNAISKKREITITFYKEDRSLCRKRVRPLSLDHSECHFFLTAYRAGHNDEPLAFRVDRITKIVEHRKRFDV